MVLFFAVRPTFAQIVSGQVDLAEYITANNVALGLEYNESGYRQIFYSFQGNKTFITSGANNVALPSAEGEYIVYMSQVQGSWQIFMYNILNGTTTRLSHGGNNVNPLIKDGNVVWESYTDEGWQVILFDGVKVMQLTTGDASMNPDVEGDYVIYGRKDTAGTWRSVVYSLTEDKAIEVSFGNKAKRPKLKKGKVLFYQGSSNEEEFPLTVEDIFVLDFTSLNEVELPLSTTEGDIGEELSATASAQFEESLSQEQLGVIGSTGSGQIE
jgi:hypothetical protein